MLDEAACKVVTDSLNFCIQKKCMGVNAYVIMPTHLHAIVFDVEFNSERLKHSLPSFLACNRTVCLMIKFAGKKLQMERDKILALLKSRKRRLKKFGIHSLSIFGSVARDQAHKNSDVDILVEFEKPIGLFEYARLKMYLEEILERPVDLVTPEALRQELREDILREAIRAA
jgi:uncharacterized protein